MARFGGVSEAFADRNFRFYSVGSIVSWVTYYIQQICSSAGTMTMNLFNAGAQFERDLLIELNQSDLKRAKGEKSLGCLSILNRKQKQMRVLSSRPECNRRCQEVCDTLADDHAGPQRRFTLRSTLADELRLNGIKSSKPCQDSRASHKRTFNNLISIILCRGIATKQGQKAGRR